MIHESNISRIYPLVIYHEELYSNSIVVDSEVLVLIGERCEVEVDDGDSLVGAPLHQAEYDAIVDILEVWEMVYAAIRHFLIVFLMDEFSTSMRRYS